MHKFTTESLTDFNFMIHQAVRSGLTFESDSKNGTYTITYLGGY